MGFLYILFGAITILIALAFSGFREGSTTWVEAFFAKSSRIDWFMIVAGGTIFLFGVIRIISGNAPYTETKLIPFERVTGGIYFSLIGLAMLGFGAWLVVSPSTWKALFEFIVALIKNLIPR